MGHQREDRARKKPEMLHTLPSLSTDRICSQLGRVLGITVRSSWSNIMAARGSPRRLHAAFTSDEALNLQHQSAYQCTAYKRYCHGTLNSPVLLLRVWKYHHHLRDHTEAERKPACAGSSPATTCLPWRMAGWQLIRILVQYTPAWIQKLIQL